MENFKDIKQFAEMLNNEYPVSKDGSFQRDNYALGIKGKFLNKKTFQKLCIETIPETLGLFPIFPKALTFIEWTTESSLDNGKFYKNLLHFLSTEWTEEKYPDRIFERICIIRHMAQVTSIDYRWIQKSSPKALSEFLWIAHDIAYIYNEEESLVSLGDLSSKDDNFAGNLSMRIPSYLEDFSKDQLKEFFKPWMKKLDQDSRAKINKWLRIFDANRLKK